MSSDQPTLTLNLTAEAPEPKSEKKKRKHEETDDDKEDVMRHGELALLFYATFFSLYDRICKHDCVSAGGWWSCDEFEEITGIIAIEMGRMSYVKSMDNGLFTLGAPHEIGN